MNWLTGDMQLHLGEAVLRLALALLGGAVIGFEREWTRHAAGLRTHMMVALGSATLTVIAMEFLEVELGGGTALDLDPLRILSGIVGGVGFLGAGAIIQSRGKVRGLTTAAGIWVVAAVGVAAGAGLYALAGAATIFAIVTLTVVRRLEQSGPLARSASTHNSSSEQASGEENSIDKGHDE